jgi:colicin import membrane protein
MSDEDTTAAAATTPAAPAEPAKPAADAVPYDRFKEVNDSAKALKSQLDEAQKALRERDEADMSAAEREKAARERAEGELSSAREETKTYERGRMIAKAAREAGFTDPDFAAEHLAGKGGVETDAQAAKAVEALAKRIPGLVKQEQAPPQLGRVLENGQPVKSDEAALDAGIRDLDRQLSEALGFTG